MYAYVYIYERGMYAYVCKTRASDARRCGLRPPDFRSADAQLNASTPSTKPTGSSWCSAALAVRGGVSRPAGASGASVRLCVSLDTHERGVEGVLIDQPTLIG